MNRHREAQPIQAMERLTFRATLTRLNVTQEHLRRIFGCSRNTVSRWATGESPVPVAVDYLLTACLERKLTIGDLERMYLARRHG